MATVTNHSSLVSISNNSFTGTNIFGAYKDAGGNRKFFSKVYLAESFLRFYNADP